MQPADQKAQCQPRTIGPGLAVIGQLAAEQRDRPSLEREFKLVTGVAPGSLDTTFRHWRERGYDFESWITDSTTNTVSLMMSKRISMGEVSLLIIESMVSASWVFSHTCSSSVNSC